MALDILIVDDSAAIRKILQRVLRQAEIPVSNIYEAGDGLEALRVLKERPVNLVLSDMNMPNMDGLQMLAQMRAEERFQKLPVVMVTTEGSQSKVLEAAQLGALGYVRKPFTADEIREKIGAFL